MIKTLTVLVALQCIAVFSHADWYFRGTPNQWAATPMTRLDNNTYQSCQRFSSGSEDPRFKIDRFGDWQENYPADDIQVSANASYNIVFDPSNNSIDYSEVSACEDSSEFISNFPALNFRGTPNGWSTTSMRLVADNTWQVSIDFDGQSEQRFKFDVNGNWSQNYGSSGSEDQVMLNGGDIFSDVSGRYTVTLNDQSLAYTIVETDGTTTPPTTNDSWYIRGTFNNFSVDKMENTQDTTFCYTASFGSGDPRFKVDHFADWTESYPQQDFRVDPNSTYTICFDSVSKSIEADKTAQEDTLPPLVSVAPPPGNYRQSQSLLLSVEDNLDPSPLIYFSTDGSRPDTNSPIYSGGTIIAEDIGQATDLTLRTLSVDATGNTAEQSFSFSIGEPTTNAIDFREETIYFLLTARFYDGDSSNNYYNRDRVKEGDPHWRGDFKGLIQQLDYIQDLGFSAIWITPPVENRSGLDYHGYHAYDWTRVDPRLESDDASYQDFIDAAHAKGIKVIQDVVINHSSQYGIRDKVWIDHMPIKYYVPAGGEQGEAVNGPYLGNLGDYQSVNRDDNDNSVAPQWFRERHNSDPQGIVPLVDPKTGVTVPLAGYNPNRFFGIDPQTLDPDWYHLDGFIAGGDFENARPLQRKHLAGDAIDLATGNQNVKDYLNTAIKQYLDMGVDAIRLDTAKHIDRDELLSYTREWQAHKPEVFIFGEALVKGLGFGNELGNDNASAVIRPWWYTRTGSDPSNPQGDSNMSVLDFPLFSTFRDNVTRGSLSGIGGALARDWTYADPSELVTFFQNHDVGPDNDFKFRFCCDAANAALAYNLLWTIRGIPTLYYGEEVMFMAGAPQDIANADDTVDTTGRAYYGEILDDPSTSNHVLYQHIKRLNQIRKAIPALQKGEMLSINEWGAGMSFVREHQNSYVAVGLAASGDQSISLSGLRNGIYRDAVSGRAIAVNNGQLNFDVPAYSAGIYVLDGPGQIGAAGEFLR